MGDDFPRLGAPGGIFTPAKVQGVGIAPVLLADGAVRTLSAQIDLSTLRALTTRRGAEPIAYTRLAAGPSLRSQTAFGESFWLLHVIKDGKNTWALFETPQGP